MLKNRFSPGSRWFNTAIIQNGVVWAPAGSILAGGVRKELITFSNKYDKKKSHYVTGSPFFVRSLEEYHSPGHYVINQPPFKVANSYIFTHQPSSMTPSSLPGWASAATMNGYGATGINRASPNRPHGGFGQFIGELHAVPTLSQLNALKGKSNAFLRTAGREYLNIQFGWFPFLNDLIQFIDNVKNSDKLIRQLDRDSGRAVRRGSKIFSNTTSTANSSISYGYPAIPGAWLGSPHTLTTNTIVNEDIWFSGQFRYFFPPLGSKVPGDGIARLAAISRIIYGVEITPRLVWELTPWSWLADWCGNAGDVISNITNFGSDGLLMDYGFVMRRYKQLVHRTLDVGTNQGVIHATSSVISETKQRAMATPYGFGLNPNAFTARQVAILGAIAASRS